MTLRESEQSLLHNLIHPNPVGNDGAGDTRRSRGGRRLNIILAGATAAIIMVMGVVLIMETLERELAQMDVATTPGLYAELAAGWKDGRFGNSARKSANIITRDVITGDVITGDVIIPDATDQPVQNLKHLTNESGAGFLSALEVSREVVLAALARSVTENVAIASDLKFYRTENGHKVLACSDQISPYTNIGDGIRRDTGAIPAIAMKKADNSCFVIDTTPHEGVVFPTGKVL